MKRPWLWGTLAVSLGLIVLAAWLPGHRLEAELAATRREGLLTELPEVRRLVGTVPESQNAAPLVRIALVGDRVHAAAERGVNDAAKAILKERATPAQTALFRAALAHRPALLDNWIAASKRPRLVYDRHWEDGAATLFPEYAGVRYGVQRLAAAAHLGIRPRENLLAAARLATLTAQEPVLIAAVMGVAEGRVALREARRQGLAREVDVALGPSLDVRRAYAFEFPQALDVMRNEGTPEWSRRLGVRQDPPFWYRLAHAGPRRSAETLALVREWRALWRDLPKDGTDYPAAAKALRRHLPGIDRRLADWSDVYAKLGMSDPGEEAHAVETFAKYEAERKAARDSSPVNAKRL